MSLLLEDANGGPTMCLPLMDSMKTDVDSAYVWSVAGALELQGEVQRPGQDPGHFH